MPFNAPRTINVPSLAKSPIPVAANPVVNSRIGATLVEITAAFSLITRRTSSSKSLTMVLLMSLPNFLPTIAMTSSTNFTTFWPTTFAMSPVLDRTVAPALFAARATVAFMPVFPAASITSSPPAFTAAPTTLSTSFLAACSSTVLPTSSNLSSATFAAALPTSSKPNF